jgi:hypothetical protein
MQPYLSKFIKITPCSRATKLVNFHIISTLSNESWNKILPSLSSFSTYHPNVFTPILSLSEGRAGIAWVPSNKMLFFSLRYKAPLAFPQMFSLYCYSYTILSDSLSSFGFKRLNGINQLIFVMVKCGVLFEVRTEFLNIIQTSFGFRGRVITTHYRRIEKQMCISTHSWSRY